MHDLPSNLLKMSNVDIAKYEEVLLNLAKSRPEGISNDDVKENIKDLPLDSLATIINKCLKAGTLELFKTKDKLLYKYKDPSDKSAIKGADSEEKIVYSIIQKAGNKGIWIRDIRFQSNLNMTQLKKVLKSLETKKIIKFVKSVENKRKAYYMLYDLEPDNSVTGGAWYQDQDFESEFVDVLSQQCFRYLKQRSDEASKIDGPLTSKYKSYATAADVHKYINELGISNITLSEKDIESILYTVVLDGNAERTKVGTSQTFQYRYVNKFLPSPGIVKTTCGICPNANRCADTGLINPKVCVYLKEWLDE